MRKLHHPKRDDIILSRREDLHARFPGLLDAVLHACIASSDSLQEIMR